MHAYRFRILAEEQDDFLRDIEILASQTFEELHQFLVGLFEFDGKELASFSICNGKWHKLSEITLIDMQVDENDKFEDEEEKSNSGQKLKTYLMSNSKIRDFIEDPHQRIIYEYDFLHQRTFFLELSKILTVEDGFRYPRCIKSEGNLAKTGVNLKIPGELDLLDAGLSNDLFGDEKDFEDEIDDTFVKDMQDGFEIEEDQTIGMNITENFDSSGKYEENKDS